MIFGVSENGQNRPEKGLKSELLYRRYKGKKTSMKCDKCDSLIITYAHVVKGYLSNVKQCLTVSILSDNTLLRVGHVLKHSSVTDWAGKNKILIQTKT